MSSPLRIAMWSGPRNISTALMRSFDSRPDTVVCDEPLYAHYLAVKGYDHPVRAKIVQRHESDWCKVAGWLTGPLEGAATVFYQKHMAHHLLPEIERGWLDSLTHAFLIREPREMLTSLIKILPEPELEHTGLPQQVELFESVRAASGVAPPIVDSRDLLDDPEGILRLLCGRLGLEFDPCMLTWQPGLRATDGVWARHWYGNTLESTGFAPYRPKDEEVPETMRNLLRECEELYAQLHAQRLTTGS